MASRLARLGALLRSPLGACIAWVVGFPMLGAALAAEHLLRAWSSVDETTTPEQRAATLTGAIAGAANASAVSSVLGALGVPVLVWMLVQRPKKP